MTEKKSTLLPHMDFVNSDDIWDKKSAALWKEASFRHQGRIKLIAKRDNKFWLGFWTVIHWLVQAVTFGKGFNMVDGPYTTFGPLIFLPGDGSSFRDMYAPYRYSLLAHEIAHVDHMFFMDPNAQDSKPQPKPLWWNILIWGWVLVYAFGYLMLLLPYGFAWFRAWAEYHGYKRNLHVYIQNRVAWGAYYKLRDFLLNEPSHVGIQLRSELKMYVVDSTKEYKTSEKHDYHKAWYEKQFTSWNYGKMVLKARFEKLYSDMFDEVIGKLKSEEGIEETLKIAESYYIKENKVEGGNPFEPGQSIVSHLFGK